MSIINVWFQFSSIYELQVLELNGLSIHEATNVLEQADNHCQQEQATLHYHRDIVEISVNNEVIPDATNAVEKADNHCQEECIHVRQAATLNCVHQVASGERMQWATTHDYVLWFQYCDKSSSNQPWLRSSSTIVLSIH